MSSSAKLAILALVLGASGVCWWALSRHMSPVEYKPGEFLGSAACRDCHEPFYAKWSTSWHGLAMRPYTTEFARQSLTPQSAAIEIRGHAFWVEITDARGVIHEKGPEGQKSYPIEQVLGGKNLFYFLTPYRGGRLQVLPLAYDTRLEEWYDSTASMVRHFHDQTDAPVDWTDRLLTFNTSCYTCHVSQLSRNYSFETDSYQTTWGEPGINCESCHGPGRKHVEVSVAARGKAPDPLEIIVTRTFTHEQTNSLCATCHAKMTALTESFLPGELFFNHFNLVAIEDRDLYPDGRELGENYTYGPALISPCVASGQLDCMHCHTSSGRNRHAGADADKACLPCHERHVLNPAAHSFHKAESEGSRCVACHMPETVFARMRRHDHTLLPPAPAATLEFGSPNACNLCHKEKEQDAKWADQWVRKWYPRDYQKPILERARLVDAARKQDWSKLRPMLEYVTSPGRNEFFASGLLRLLQACPSPDKWPAFVKATRDPSPLVRASAATGLETCPLPEAFAALLDASADAFRVVRIQAAAALARRSLASLDPERRQRVEKALAEYEAFLRCRADDPLSHYNLGNYFQDRGDLAAAVTAYEAALKLDPKLVPALVNLSMVHARSADTARAEFALRQALRHDAGNAEANFNLGLLLVEQGRASEAETCLRLALKTDPKFAQAAYNLGVLVSERDMREAVSLCRRAAEIRPDEPRYAYTLAFYQYRSGDLDGAAETLHLLLEKHPAYGDAIALLGTIFEERGRTSDALELYRSALTLESLTPTLQRDIAAKIQELEKR